MPSTREVARFMKELYDRGDGYLYQREALSEIEEKYGEDFLLEKDDGSRGIAPAVLAEFRKLTPDTVWSKRRFFWRDRQPDDEPGRQQDI